MEKIHKSADIKQFDAKQQVSNLMYLIWSTRADLRKSFNLDTPEGQRGFLNWYKSAAPVEYGLTPAEQQKVHNAEMPINIVQSLRGWRKLAALLPATLKFRLKLWLLKAFGQLQSTGQKRAATSIRHDDAEFPQQGANLIGYAFTESGMGEHVRMSAASFSTTDVPFHVIDFNYGVVSRQAATLEQGNIGQDNIYKVNIFHINADQILNVVLQKGDRFFRNRINIGYPFWELSQFPKQWVPALNLMDELWAPTRHIQGAIAEATGSDVHHMPIAVTLPEFEVLPRVHFGLPEDHYIFFCAFDFLSFVHRKNPWGVVHAFLNAFPDKKAPVILMIKVMNAKRGDPEWEKLNQLAAEDSRIILLNKTMTKGELLALKNVCNSYVSLHRAEGFGLGPAEAMLLEKPVIVTNYSGSSDYAHEDNACVVDYRLIPIGVNQYPFGEGKVWADPDLEHAAWHMKNLFEHPEIGVELGLKARKFMLENHAPEKCGQNYKKRLTELGIL